MKGSIPFEVEHQAHSTVPGTRGSFGWSWTLQAASYVRHVRIIRTIWLLMLSFKQNIVRACSMFYPYEGYRSVTPLDDARVSRTIFHNHSVHWYHITLLYYAVPDIILQSSRQAPRTSERSQRSADHRPQQQRVHGLPHHLITMPNHKALLLALMKGAINEYIVQHNWWLQYKVVRTTYSYSRYCCILYERSSKGVDTVTTNTRTGTYQVVSSTYDIIRITRSYLCIARQDGQQQIRRRHRLVRRT